LTTTTRTEINSSVIIFSTGVALCALLLVIRAYILGFGWNIVRSPFTQFPKMLVGAYYDFLFVAVVTLVFLIVLQAARNHITLQRIIYIVFVNIALVLLGLALLNIKMVQMLGSPFNYRWLYYSDFLRAAEKGPSIHAMLTWKIFLLAFTMIIGMALTSMLSARGIRLILTKHISAKSLTIYIALIFLLYFIVGGWYMNNINHWNYTKLENPTFSLLYSVVARDTPKLFTMNTPFGPEDFLVAAERPKAITMTNRDHTGTSNVLIYVLESVAAEYLEAYGGTYPVTPELNKYRNQWIMFKNIYSHAPTSNKALVSMLCSVYPRISYTAITKENPGITLSSLSSELKQRGYRTAFFSSGDTSFQDQDRFLAHRRFDVVQDNKIRTCDKKTYTGISKDAAPFEGSDDECTADSFMEWVKAAPEQPFFAILWTNMTHFPYYVVGKETDFGVDMKSAWEVEFFNRYLNALRHTDQALGKILQMLEDKGLSNSTIVVVVGDHGEAFGQHEQYGHAANIYEENVHVPLIFINPRLFNGEENPGVGGLIDIAPTIMDLLQFQLPGDWQGRSLFSKDRSNRVYFFSPWKELMFGYREANRKFIFNATNNKDEIYDLIQDPMETNNLANNSSDEILLISQRLAAWVQYQNRLINNLAAPRKAALE
jgi:lipoteichoic acid synthase